MRPKKKILLVDIGPMRRSLLRLVLRVHGYSVYCVGIGKHDLRPYDAMLVCGDVNVKWKGRPRTPTVWYAQTVLKDIPCGVRVAESEGKEVLLETIRRSVLRKRGPKPGKLVA